MKPKRRRLLITLAGLAVLSITAVLVLTALEDGIVFFYSPSDLVEKPVPKGRSLRVGGLVEEGSTVRGEGTAVSFRITDFENTVKVSYSGMLPDLFREGQGVVALGTLNTDGSFAASEVLAKHDENYTPPEVTDALERAGHSTKTLQQ